MVNCAKINDSFFESLPRSGPCLFVSDVIKRFKRQNCFGSVVYRNPSHSHLDLVQNLVICNVRNLWRRLLENVKNEKNQSQLPFVFLKNAPSGNRTRVSTLEVSYSTSELSAQVRRVGVEPTRFRIGS